ncbi:RNA polymerase sigma factor [Streptomyces sanglieri]|uniref:RNA polymerase sigma factor n=1 Tax=Streptomyces sanglieri TaxID=193460 RepID=A0ABW2X9T4_9ACTN
MPDYDADRFTAIYDGCRQRVWAYVVSRAGRQVADEVVNETFTVAWRKLDDVPESPLPWLLGVARNILRDNIRAEARRASFAAELRSWGNPPRRTLPRRYPSATRCSRRWPRCRRTIGNC